MQKLVWGCVLALGALGGTSAFAADAALPTKAPAAVAVVQGWTYSLNTEFQYYSWTSNRGFPVVNDPTFGNPGKGSQIYVPTALSMTGLLAPDLKMEFVARTGFVSSRQTTPGQQGEIGTTTDSQLSSTITYSGLNGIQPFGAMLVNLPTGASAIYGPNRFARMDPDLVALSSFGEGFNVGPTAGVNIPLSAEWLATMSGGYTYRGRFNKEGAIDLVTLAQPTDKVKPGDSTTITGALGYAAGAISAQGSVSYSWDTSSLVNGITQYRAGQRLTVTGSGAYAWTDQWRTSVNGFFTHAERNDAVDAFLNLTPEPFNSNSNVFRVNADTTYTFANGVTIGPTGSYLYRDRNSYDPFTFTFVAAKTRLSGGVTGGYTMGNFSVTGRVERIWTRENEVVAAGTPVVTSNGWFTSFGGTFQF